jgi:hypothetical protein
MESTVPRKNLLLIAGFAGTGLLVLIVLMFTGSVFKPWRSEPSNSWNREAIQATYVASQLRQVDKARSTLVLSYDLENNSDVDYRVADGPGVLILSRLKSDGSLSQEQPIRLSYPVFLPAKQRARIAVEITQPLAWPVQDDPAYEDKLRDFVKQRLANVGAFVLFDESSHRQIELPGAWEELQEAAQAGY